MQKGMYIICDLRFNHFMTRIHPNILQTKVLTGFKFHNRIMTKSSISYLRKNIMNMSNENDQCDSSSDKFLCQVRSTDSTGQIGNKIRSLSFI